MDYRLRRQPDGSVNAMPGDAVEFAYDTEWKPAVYRGLLPQNTNTIDIAVLRLPSAANDFPTALEHVRHACGGAGWHRLREARLRAVVEDAIRERWNTTEGHIQEYERLIGSMKAAIADLDNAEPEA
jgi:hypothetical protein